MRYLRTIEKYVNYLSLQPQCLDISLNSKKKVLSQIVELTLQRLPLLYDGHRMDWVYSGVSELLGRYPCLNYSLREVQFPPILLGVSLRTV